MTDTDTDKLKRLAVDLKLEAERAHHDQPIYEKAYSAYRAILYLIAENERMKKVAVEQAWEIASLCGRLDEAVALLRANMMYPDDGKTARETQAFLARIGAEPLKAKA